MAVRDLIRETTGVLAAPWPVKALVAATRQPLILPFYHSVSDERAPHLANVLQIRNVRTFRADLGFFLRHYEPVDAATLVKITDTTLPLRKPAFHLSFDDGLKEIVTLVAPILREKGIPATFFLNTGFIGNRDLFYRFKVSILLERIPGITEIVSKAVNALLDQRKIMGPTLHHRLLSVSYSHRDVLEEMASLMDFSFREYLAGHPVYLDENDIRNLLAQGFTIGAHSHDHPGFREISTEEQLLQVKTSTKILKENFGISQLFFSFPFSDEKVSKSFFEMLYPPGGDVELSFGISGLKKEEQPRHFHRIPMETGDSSAMRIVKGEYLYYLLKMPFCKNKITRN